MNIDCQPTSIFSNKTMCNTCSPAQVKFTTPITLAEIYNMGYKKFLKRCRECNKPAFVITKFTVPSLISSWKILTPTSQKYEKIDNVVYTFRTIV